MKSLSKEAVRQQGITRRQFVRWVGMISVTGTLFPLLQACGGDTANEPESGAAPTVGATGTSEQEAQATSAGGDGPSGAIVFATDQTIPTQDPHFVDSQADTSFSTLMFEPLIVADLATPGQFLPKLAMSWDVGSDQNTWTFTLRDEVSFHDGTPFDAGAVKYTFDRLRDPATGAIQFGLLSSVASVDVVDPMTVNIVTSAPYPELLTNLSAPAAAIISPTAAGKGALADFGRAPVGTGPFRFKEWPNVDTLTAEANPDYWGAMPSVATITLRSVPEMGAIVAGLEAGEFDVAVNLPPDQVKRLQEVDGLSVEVFDLAGADKVGMLNSKKPFDDVRVRRALNYAVNRQAIVDAILGSFGQVTTTPLFVGLPYRVEQEPYTYDPERAKQLLAEAGYPDGFSTTLLYAPIGTFPTTVQAVAADFKEVGVEVDLQSREQAVWGQLVTAKDDTRDMWYEHKGGLGVDFNLTRLYAKSSWDVDNRSRYFNQRVEDLLVEARSSFDETARANAYGEIQKIVWEDAPDVFLISEKLPLVATSQLQNFKVTANGYLLLAEATKTS